jgi:hypothetical protein
VITQVELSDRQKPDDILKLYVRNNKGVNISLASILKIVPYSTPPALFHYNRYKAATFSASLAEGKTIGDGVEVMQKIADDLTDDSYQTSLTGTSRDYSESSSNTAFAFILALILIYLILAAQFESFKDPFIIMLTVPLAIAGAVLCLWMFGHTINIFSEIGLIMLIGLVTKNKKRAWKYVELEANTKVLSVEFIESYKLLGKDEAVLKVKTTDKECPDWYVVGGDTPINLYDIRKFSSPDEVFSFHTGIMIRLMDKNYVESDEPSEEIGYDAFISHATEDKEDIVRPLAQLLKDYGFRIWFDEFELEIGDSLRESIDKGLVNSRYGIVILSPKFLNKNWTKE